jgi:hypothetical protein
MNDLDEVLRACIGILDRLGIPHLVMGGLAIRVLGIPRPTFDVDLTIAIPRGRLPELYEELDVAGFDVPEAYRGGWVDEVAGMPLVKFKLYIGERGIDADIFLAETRFQREMMRRRRSDMLWGIPVSIVTPEDLVLLKLLANRSRDLGDIEDLRMVQGDLDEAYMRRWASELGITDRLERALSEPPL